MLCALAASYAAHGGHPVMTTAAGARPFWVAALRVGYVAALATKLSDTFQVTPLQHPPTPSNALQRPYNTPLTPSNAPITPSNTPITPPSRKSARLSAAPRC